MLVRFLMLCKIFALVALFGYQGVSLAQQVLSRADAAGIVEIENLRIDGDAISGEIVNRSPHAVRDIQLLVRQDWQWRNEFRPGADNPGRAIYHHVEDEIAPGGRAPFTHRFGEPLPQLTGGEFETRVEVAAYTSVVPQ